MATTLTKNKIVTIVVQTTTKGRANKTHASMPQIQQQKSPNKNGTTTNELQVTPSTSPPLLVNSPPLSIYTYVQDNSYHNKINLNIIFENSF